MTIMLKMTHKAHASSIYLNINIKVKEVKNIYTNTHTTHESYVLKTQPTHLDLHIATHNLPCLQKPFSIHIHIHSYIYHSSQINIHFSISLSLSFSFSLYIFSLFLFLHSLDDSHSCTQYTIDNRQ